MLFAATLGMFHKSVLKKMKLFFGEARWKFKVVNPSCLEPTPSCGCGCCRKSFTFHVLGGEVCTLAPDVRWERPATDNSGFEPSLPLAGAWEQRGRASGCVDWRGEGEWGGEATRSSPSPMVAVQTAFLRRSPGRQKWGAHMALRLGWFLTICCRHQKHWVWNSRAGVARKVSTRLLITIYIPVSIVSAIVLYMTHRLKIF